MTARKTRCLTWGETRRTGGALTNGNGQRVGFLDFEEWVTLCGKPDDDPCDTSGLDASKSRPIGVCRACWKQYRIETRRPEVRP